MGALDGTTVIDLSHFVAGPYCSMLLADHGAKVIKVEPIDGDPTRCIEPRVGDEEGGVSVYFARLNRNKESLSIDLRSERGRAVLTDLVRGADVLVENFRAGALARLGFSAAELAALNERLVYCSISGFGHTPGPYRDRPAFAPVVEAMAAVTRWNPAGGSPLVVGLAVGDLFTGSMAFGAINMALYERERTGKGRHIDMSMYDAMLSLNERPVFLAAQLDGVDARAGAPVFASTPSDIFPTKDGHITISIVGEHIWERFCEAIGRADLVEDARLASVPGRIEHYDDVLMPAMDAWLQRHTTAEAVEVLLAGGVPVGEVLSPAEVVESEQGRLRNMFIDVPTYAGIDVTAAASPIPWGEAPRVEGIPALGEDTVEILEELLGYDRATVEELRSDGVVAGPRRSGDRPGGAR
jgi:CoA:oxalate CoA-transferase